MIQKRQIRVGEPEKKERSAAAMQRRNIYRFLAAVYRQEVTPDFLQQIKDPRFWGVLSDLGLDLPGDFFQIPEEEEIDRCSQWVKGANLSSV